MRSRENETPERLEQYLQEGMAHLLKGMEEEAPPDVAALQMLVHQVQQEQRRALKRDLTRFGLVALIILATTLYSLLQSPVYYLIAQGILGVFLVAGALVWQVEGRRLSGE